MTQDYTSSLPEPVMMDGELRIGDIALAETLGFEKPRNIRKLIHRHQAYLEEMATCSTVEHVVRGNPVTEFFLTEEQASYIGMMAQTPKAARGRIALIRAFKAMKKELEARRSDDGSALDLLAQSLVQLAEAMTAQAARIARLEAGIKSTVEKIPHERHSPALTRRLEKQSDLFELPDDPAGLARALSEFRPISAFLDLAPLAARRRFLVAGRAAQSCASWLMKHERGAFVRSSRETGRLLFHPDGVEAWFAATGRNAA